MNLTINLYGAKRCSKTNFYIDYFRTKNIAINFYDVEENEAYAETLRSLYENRRLNFPTITIAGKKLRNPTLEEIEKWLQKKGISY